MKKFRFPLDKLRAWRRLRFDTEQARLQALLAGRRRLELRRLQLLEELDRPPALAAPGRPAAAEELAALNSYRSWAQHELARLARELAQLDRDLAAQRQRLLEARRDVEVLERLRERRLAQWRADLSKEEEQIAAELAAARWKAAGG
jgi:flagellar FliJ protein